MTGPNGLPLLLTADETLDPRRAGGSAAPQRGALDQSRARRDVDLPQDVDQPSDVDLPPALVNTLARALARALVRDYTSEAVYFKHRSVVE